MVEENDTTSFSTELALNQPASLLEMAQRVHDDFVAKGRDTAEKLEFDAQKKHDELISSAKEFHNITMLETESNAAAIIEDAQLSAFTLISDAKIKADGIVSDAYEKTLHLESSILKLQEFEATYRSNLLALVSGAQATLAVAELAVDESELSTPDSDEELATESEVLVIDESPTETEDDPEVDDDEVPESEDDSEEDEDSSDDETVEPTPVVYTVVEETPESIYYNPLATKSAIDEATVASILGQSGLGTDSSYETAPTIINANPGAGWSLYADADSEDIVDDEDVDSDETSADEDENDSEASHEKEDKEEK